MSRHGKVENGTRLEIKRLEVDREEGGLMCKTEGQGRLDMIVKSSWRLEITIANMEKNDL